MVVPNTDIPAPGPPSSDDSCTRQSRNTTSAMGDDRRPSFATAAPTSTPGVSRSTTNAATPLGPVASASAANTTNTSATGAFVMNVLAPLSTKPPSTRVAVVATAIASDPEPVWVTAWTPISDPSHNLDR